MVHATLFSFGLEELEGFPLHARGDHIWAVLGMGFVKVIQPGEGKVEAGHIFILTGSIDGFLHCLKRLAENSMVDMCTY